MAESSRSWPSAPATRVPEGSLNAARMSASRCLRCFSSSLSASSGPMPSCWSMTSCVPSPESGRIMPRMGASCSWRSRSWRAASSSRRSRLDSTARLFSAPNPPPMRPPASMPMAAALPTPSSQGLPSATFCHTCSWMDCGSSSNTPSDRAEPPTLRSKPFVPTPMEPCASAVSMSPSPSRPASFAPAAPSTAAPRPEAPAIADCVGVSSPSSVSARIWDAAAPAPRMPSPPAAAFHGASFGATLRMPRAMPAPPSIWGIDSPAAVTMVLGFWSAVDSVSTNPSACRTLALAACCASEYHVSRIFWVSSGR